MLRTWDELETLHRLAGRPAYLYCSQGGRSLPDGSRTVGYLERKTGFRRETVCRAIAGLCALGVIRKTFRRRNERTGQWCTCLYELVPQAKQWSARIENARVRAGALAARFAARREAKRREACARAMREQAERFERERERQRALMAWDQGGRRGSPPVSLTPETRPSSPSSPIGSLVDRVTLASPKREANSKLLTRQAAVFAKYVQRE